MALLQAAAVLGAAQAVVAAAPRPHLVYVLTDNLGWGNVGYHRKVSPTGPTKEVVTPNVDSLVATGVELDRFYTYKFCSPSRSSLLTGRLPQHVNMHNLAHSVPGAGIPLGMSTIADKLKTEGGYSTHMVGKWHCGMASAAHTPLGRGFDSYLGYFDGFNDYLHAWSYTACPDQPGLSRNITYEGSVADRTKCTAASVKERHLKSTTDLWLNDHPAHGLNGSGFEEALFEERVLGIIAGHDPTVPLFLYYPMHLVHSPLCVPEEYLEKFSFIAEADDNTHHDRQYVAAMLSYMDDVIGNVASALKDAGLWNNTLMVWSSDNGAAVELCTGMKNSYPLRGGYYTNWEGGVRANALVNGGLLPHAVRGTKLAGVGSYIHLCDWWATFLFLAGVDPRDDKAAAASLPPPDSLNMWPLLSGQNTTSPRVEIAFSPLRGLWDPGRTAGAGGIGAEHYLDSFDRRWSTPESRDDGGGGEGGGGVSLTDECDPSGKRSQTHSGRVGDAFADLRDPMLIVGKYKLLLGVVDQCWWQGPQYPNGSSTWDTHATEINCTSGCLFDIITDPTEHHDLASELPAVVASMRQRLGELQRTVFDPDRGLPELRESCAQCAKNGGFWGPWQTP